MRRIHGNINAYLKSLKLYEGETRRDDCPACGGKHTFSVTKQGGSLLWNCYRASCELHGRSATGRTATDVVRFFSPVERRVGTPASLPDSWVNFTQSEAAVQFTVASNSLFAANKGFVHLFYDARLERCVYVNPGRTHAAGRRLNNNGPKWLNYFTNPETLPMIGPDTDTLVLVEDFPSACNLTRFVRSAPLLGTNLPLNICASIPSQIKTVWIALDNDATAKAMKHQKLLSSFRPAKILPLREDIKHLSPDVLQKYLSIWGVI